ncbi:trophoblast glycoprotein [Bombina bombina]|uniref:trophoblast glycoprotein n=1 Tax=Bombina bombina TaxID=8345 RepID=UPI00235A5114|nr:trophoblast glycoprotein [Bombina bombina]
MIAFDPLYLLGLWRRDRRGPGLSGELERRKETWSKPAFVLILLHILGSAWSQSEQLYSCPAFCECSKQAETVKCVNKNLTVLPRDFPPYVRTLFITGNRISSLHEGAFKQLHSLEKLSNLNFSGNRLQELGSNVFSDLPNLTQLDLSNNLLENVSSLAFQGAANGSNSLIELNLSNTVFNESLISLLGAALQRGALKSLNRLELAGNNLLYLPMGMFDSLPSLKHLDLHNNSLLGLQPGIFTKLKQLETLDLSSNSFKFLENNTLFDLPKQPGLVINFNNNSWVCDCQIGDFASWLNESTVVKDAVTLMCSSPEKMNATPIVSIKLSELECYDIDDTSLQTSYVFLGIVLALIGVIFLLVLYLNRKGIKKWIYNIRDACRDHMEGYHYRYEINADPRLTNLNTNSDV